MHAPSASKEGTVLREYIRVTGANNEPIEKVLRRGYLDTFSILEYSIHKALGLELCDANKYSNILKVKSFVLCFMRKYQDTQPEFTL